MEIKKKFLTAVFICVAASAYPWESQLFPYSGGSYNEAVVSFGGRDWRLLDYSYVGYNLGETGLRNSIPCTSISITGSGDITAEIQAAVNTLQSSGGGRVVIPPGVFTISSRITINRRNISIEGAGSGRTILEIPSSIVLLEGANDFQGVFTFEYAMDGWNKGWPDRGAILSMVMNPVPEGAMYLTGLTNSANVNTGDWIVIQQYWWQEFTQQNSDGVWQYYPNNHNRESTFTYLRRVMGKDAGGIQIDAPIPFHLNPADSPIHIRRSGPNTASHQMLDNVGISGLTINFADNNSGTNSRPRGAGVAMEGVLNGWIYDVTVYNFPRYGFYFEYCARISFVSCVAKKTQDYGGDGYGYGYHNHASQNVLINNSYAEDMRHAYIFQKSLANYCVVANSESVDCRQGEDTHHSFSHAILRDNLLHKNGNKMVGYNRGTTSSNAYETYGTGVNWNVTGDGIGGVWNGALFSMNPAPYPAAYTHGIMVGGPGAYRVFDNGSHKGSTYIAGDLIPNAPGFQVGPNGDRNMLYEGLGQEGLEPRSLYLEQLRNRLGTIPAVWDASCGAGPGVPAATPTPNTGPNHLVFNSEHAAWGSNFGSACPLPLNTLTPGNNLDDMGQARSAPEGFRVQVSAGSNWTPMIVFGGPDLAVSDFTGIEMWIYPTNAATEFYLTLMNDRSGSTLGSSITVTGAYAQGGVFTANTWNRVTIPFSMFSYSGIFSGLRFARTANAPAVFYMDDIYLIPSGTPVITPTRTRTWTATLTRTQTATFTRTQTATLTATQTATLTRTQTASATETQAVATATLTRTQTASATETQAVATATLTRTQTASVTPFSTATNTPASINTETLTPAVTATATPTPDWSTMTATLTGTATQEATFTNTPGETFTQTPMATQSVSPTITPFGTNTASFTATGTLVVTLTPVQTATFTATPAITQVVFTHTATPVLDHSDIAEFEFIDVLPFPNPHRPGIDKLGITLEFQGAAEKGGIRIYTVSMRLVREYHLGPLSGGRMDIILVNDSLADFSPGIYYIIAKGCTAEGLTRNSTVEKLIVIR